MNGVVVPATTGAADVLGSAGTARRIITDTITGATSGTKGTGKIVLLVMRITVLAA